MVKLAPPQMPSFLHLVKKWCNVLWYQREKKCWIEHKKRATRNRVLPRMSNLPGLRSLKINHRQIWWWWSYVTPLPLWIPHLMDIAGEFVKIWREPGVCGQGIPGSESRTGGQLVSPAGGCEKKNWTFANMASKVFYNHSFIYKNCCAVSKVENTWLEADHVKIII